MRPLCIDLFCGLGGWAEGFLAHGYDVVGFDIERRPYPGQLVLQDVPTLHGSQFRNAAVIVASPPCQEFSYMAMPWTLAKAKAAAIRADETGEARRKLTALFDACFRIQREACEAANIRQYDGPCGAFSSCRRLPEIIGHFGFPVCLPCYRYGVDLHGLPKDQAVRAGYRYIPMVVENVKGAQPWVGPAKAHFGSFYLWGDVESVGGRITVGRFGHSLRPSRGRKVKNAYAGTGSWKSIDGEDWRDSSNVGGAVKAGGDWFSAGENCSPMRRCSGSGGTKQAGLSGPAWFDTGIAKHSSGSSARKMASAQIAKIPFALAEHIAQTYKPEAPNA